MNLNTEEKLGKVLNYLAGLVALVTETFAKKGNKKCVDKTKRTTEEG